MDIAYPARSLAHVALLLCALPGPALVAQGGPQAPDTAQHAFPVQGPRPGKMRFVRAFPNLSFVRPLFLTHAGDGTDRIFVVEQDGVISVHPNQEQASSRSIFLDLRGKVRRAGNEEGLLGMAFDPDYRQNGFFYVHYSVAAGARRSRIARFSVSAQDPDKADPNSERILLEVAQPYSNHNAGMLAFGPDKMLYIGMGDGGSGGDPHNHGQDRTTLLGTILRIDPHGSTRSLPYGIPNDNPFVGLGQGIREEIWAYGLRNPWRFSFDPLSGRLFCSDVGQNAREEVSLVHKGSNLGWRIREGDLDYDNPQNLPPSQFQEPLIAYDRTLARSITGGYVYRGQRLPELRGAYIHGDYATGNVWAVVEQGGKLVSNTLLGNFGTAAGGLSSFGVDQHDELYLVSHHGSLWKLDRATGNPPQFPLTLSSTGLFQDVRTLTPAKGVYPYDVNHPFWSDHAQKQRWFAYPGTQVTFSAKDAWGFAQGSVFVKHFDMEMRAGDPGSKRRLETRVLVHEQDGWAGYTYRWNAQGTDADLVGADGENEQLRILDQSGQQTVRVQDWRYPSRNECLQCHTQASGRVLSARTRQLNRTVLRGSQPVEQLEDWDRIGMFGSSIGSAQQYEKYPARADLNQTLDVHARTWLDVNCAMCHQPGGGTPSNLDLRFDTPKTQMNAFGQSPSLGDLGLRQPEIIKVHEREASVLWERVRRLGDARMPQIGSNAVDTYAVTILGLWIGAPFEVFGQSCGGSRGAPLLRQQAGADPRLGGTFACELQGLPSDEGAVLFLGFDPTRWGSLPLPIPLDGLGMLGCELYVPGDVIYPLPVSGGRAPWSLPIVNDKRLLSVRFYLQGLALATGANPFGMISSNAAQVTIVGP